MIRVACFSDTHGQHNSEKLNNWFSKNSGDILIHAGDFQLTKFDDGTDFLNWIAQLPFTKKVITFGNHDGNYDIFTQEAKKFKDVIVLNQEYTRVFGVNIFASPYSLNFLNWWFMKSESELEDLYAKIPTNTHILVTHTPAFGILDEAGNGYSCGSRSLLERIEELPKLKYHICGHIHEGYGIQKNGKLTSINGAVLNEQYQLVNMPIKFNI